MREERLENERSGGRGGLKKKKCPVPEFQEVSAELPVLPYRQYRLPPPAPVSTKTEYPLSDKSFKGFTDEKLYREREREYWISEDRLRIVLSGSERGFRFVGFLRTALETAAVVLVGSGGRFDRNLRSLHSALSLSHSQRECARKTLQQLSCLCLWFQSVHGLGNLSYKDSLRKVAIFQTRYQSTFCPNGYRRRMWPECCQTGSYVGPGQLMD